MKIYFCITAKMQLAKVRIVIPRLTGNLLESTVYRGIDSRFCENDEVVNAFMDSIALL